MTPSIKDILFAVANKQMTQADALAHIESLIELQQLFLEDTFAAAALQGLIAHYGHPGCGGSTSDLESIAITSARAMLEVRSTTCTKSQTLAHYGEQARLAVQEGGAK